MTSAKAALSVTRKRPWRSRRARLRETCSPSSGRMARGSGDHHSSSWSSYGHGKIPARYAAISVDGSRSPPSASSPSGSARAGSGNSKRHGARTAGRGVGATTTSITPPAYSAVTRRTSSTVVTPSRTLARPASRSVRMPRSRPTFLISAVVAPVLIWSRISRVTGSSS